ncbi:MAG: hypothetical protein ACI87O_001478, partial [Planctomycetota bacterium]
MQFQSWRGLRALASLKIHWLALFLLCSMTLPSAAQAQTAQDPFGTAAQEKALPIVLGVEVNGLRSYSEESVLG